MPINHGIKCAGANFAYTIFYLYAIKLINYPVVMMIRSCSLLSVVLVGVLFSGVTDTSLKLGGKKIIIALIATFGIVIFKVYDPNQRTDEKIS